MSVAQQHARLAVAAEVLKVNQRKPAGRVGTGSGAPGNGLMAQVVDAQLVAACQSRGGANPLPSLVQAVGANRERQFAGVRQPTQQVDWGAAKGGQVRSGIVHPALKA